MRGRAHRAGAAMMARAAAYVKGGRACEPQLLEPLEPRSPEPLERFEPLEPLEPCCDCVVHLAAATLDNSEYRDYFPTVKGMIDAVECLDAYQDVFPTLADMHAYIQKHGPPVAWQ